MQKILFVEDDPFLRSILIPKLESAGYEAEEALDGPEGLKAAKELKPDIILLDLILPNLDGFEVLRQLKADSATAAIPVIILTNLGQQTDTEKGLQLGAAAYLIKAESTPSDIIAKIQEILPPA